MFGAILAEMGVAFSIFSHGFDSSYFPTTAMQKQNGSQNSQFKNYTYFGLLICFGLFY